MAVLSKQDYDNWEEKRQSDLQYILNNLDTKNILVAGPGTGKSFAFKEICASLNNGANVLVLTFINELIKDLAKNLARYTDEVRTLHSYARSKCVGREIFLGLDELLSEEYEIIFDEKINFAKKFHNLEVDTESHEFYRVRKQYYKHESPNSIVYSLLRLYQERPERIPRNIDLILIDEYQDFNKLEAEFIDVLSTHSSLLLVGDDEQALYTEFRHARPELIRAKYRDEEWEQFQLKYCSRCPSVIVEAYNQVLKRAVDEGRFSDRIEDKEFIYFREKKKDNLSDLYPHIIFKKRLMNKAGFQALFIKKEIEILYRTDPDSDFDVLVICTNNDKVQKIAKSLRKQGFASVSTNKSKQDKQFEKIVRGLELIKADPESNLGWRVLCETFLTKTKFQRLIIQSYETGGSFVSFVSEEDKTKIEKLGKTYKKLIDSSSYPNEDAIKNILELFDAESREICRKFIQNIRQNVVSYGNYPFSDTAIKVTTMTGAKGLSYDYVFMLNFSDEMILSDGLVTDLNTSNFLVSLSRAKKRAYISSNRNTPPVFLEWVDKDLVREHK